jgi:hypothetical protein
MEYFLKQLYKTNPANYVKIVNEKTKEGWTPLMLCSFYGAKKCMEILLTAGGVKPFLTDNNRRTAEIIASNLHFEDMVRILKAERSKVQKPDLAHTTPVNFVYLNSVQEEVTPMPRDVTIKVCTIEDKEEHKELLSKGDRLPCVICLGNLGFIKYTTCCGQPMHPMCKSDTLTHCPFCKKSFWDLTSEIEFPERAFELKK